MSTTTPHLCSTLPDADPIGLAKTLGEIAATYAGTGERERCLAGPVADAFVTSGLAGLIAPIELGGQAADPTTVVDVLSTIAAADGSAGWCAAIGMGINHLPRGTYLAPRAALFTNVAQPGCGVFAPTGRAVRTADGYELSGRWAFTSGCDAATVQACGAFVFDDAGVPELTPEGLPILRLLFVPAGSIDVIETWDTAGLRGTGSHDTVARAVTVPATQTMTFADRAWSDAPIYRVPSFCILATCLASVGLGIGRAALDGFERDAVAEHDRSPVPGPRTRFADDQLSQLDLGRAEVRLRAARLLLIECVERCCELGAAGELPRVEIAMIGLACSEAVRAALHAVDVACQLTGSAAVRAGAPLERRRRDIDTLCKHQAFWASNEVPLARQVAGIPTVAFPFLAHPITAEGQR